MNKRIAPAYRKTRSRTPTPAGHRCTKCGTRDLTAFHKDSRSTSGLQSYCKDCSMARRGVWAHKNRSSINAYMRLWRKKQNISAADWKKEVLQYNKEQALEMYRTNVYDANMRAKRHGARFEELDVVDWVEVLQDYPECPKCGMHWGLAGKPTLDHIRPLMLGGRNHKDNIQPLCLQCNRLKGKKTEKYYAKQQNETED